MDAADVLILGAGAAGLMCALTASAPGPSAPRILLADANPVPGRKMRLAGGGMGNVTNLQLGSEWYVGEDPAFTRPLLRAFPGRAALNLLEGFGLRWEEREFGQIFGLQPMAALVEAMAGRCARNGVVLLSGQRALAVRRNNNAFVITLHGIAGPREVRAGRLVLALGSPACPASGASDAGLALARSLGHSCVPFRPALAPLVLPERHPLLGLQGISTPVGFTAGPQRLIRPLLFTHKGFSGPAGLIASCFRRGDEPLLVDFLPALSLQEAMNIPENSKLSAASLLRRHLPARLAEALTLAALNAMRAEGVAPPEPARHLAEWNRAQRAVLVRLVHSHDLTPARSEGMRQAEAAAGGVCTAEVDPRTCASRLVPGLYLAGELLDVTGLLGGYNLHWALASGRAVGQALLREGRNASALHSEHNEFC